MEIRKNEQYGHYEGLIDGKVKFSAFERDEYDSEEDLTRDLDNWADYVASVKQFRAKEVLEAEGLQVRIDAWADQITKNNGAIEDLRDRLDDQTDTNTALINRVAALEDRFGKLGAVLRGI